MALSTRPTPPPDPPSTAAATTITTTSTISTTTTNVVATSASTTARPIFPRPSPPPPAPPPPPPHTLPLAHLYQPHPTRLPSPYHPHPHTTAANNVVYPLASSGRGAPGRSFLPKQPPVTLHRPNPNPNPNPSLNLFPTRPSLAYQRQQLGFDRGLPDPGQAAQLGQSFGFIRAPTHLQHSLIVSSSPSSSSAAATAAAASAVGLVKGVPLSKVGLSQTMIPDSNGFKDVRDRSKDDNLAIIRDRKVRVSEDASLYALCRSWLRNGCPDESQQNYVDVAKSLPRPLPLAPEDSQSLAKREDDKEEEDEGSVEHLSPQELLHRHVKRAKRVRSRLREERLCRIARYKTRLAYLLPPMVEQHFRNDQTAGNGNAS